VIEEWPTIPMIVKASVPQPASLVDAVRSVESSASVLAVIVDARRSRVCPVDSLDYRNETSYAVKCDFRDEQDGGNRRTS
jgi:hypothetical protein